MKTLYMIIVCILCGSLFSPVFSRTFYVSSKGNDNNSEAQAQNSATPWASIGKINSVTLKAGDSVLFKRNDVFEGQLEIKFSGSAGQNIVISSYGDGDNPVFVGTKTVNNWTNDNQHIYKSKLPDDVHKIQELFYNKMDLTLARYPNSGYLIISDGDKNTFKDNKSNYQDNVWDNSEVVFRPNRWALIKTGIQKYSDGTFYAGSKKPYGFIKGWGYFIQNNIHALDSDGEWFFDSTNHYVYIYSNNDPAASNGGYSYTYYNYGVIIKNQKYVSINNINFFGYQIDGINEAGSSDIEIANNKIESCYKAGIEIINSGNTKLSNNFISGCFNNAIFVSNGNSINISGNNCKNIGVKPGYGESSALGLIAVDLEGKCSNAVISHNVIDSVGYIGILFSGANIVIENNYIANCCLLLDDGAAINTQYDKNLGNEIKNNIVVNTIGNGDGTPEPNQTYAEGIYLDDGTANVTVSGNTVCNSDDGIFIHNSSNNTVINNTVFNNRKAQILFKENNLEQMKSYIRDNVIRHNLIFALKPEQICLDLQSVENDINNFSTADSNMYYNPFNDKFANIVYHTEDKKVVHNVTGYNGWANFSNQKRDLFINKNHIDPVKILDKSGDNLVTNPDFADDVKNWHVQDEAKSSSLKAESVDNDNAKYLHVHADEAAKIKENLVFTNNFGVETGNTYMVQFSAKAQANSTLYVDLRSAEGKYQLLDSPKEINLEPELKQYSLYFKPNGNGQTARLEFEQRDNINDYWVGKVLVQQVKIDKVSPQEYFQIIYNTSDKPIPIDHSGIKQVLKVNSDVNELKPFESAILCKTELN